MWLLTGISKYLGVLFALLVVEVISNDSVTSEIQKPPHTSDSDSNSSNVVDVDSKDDQPDIVRILVTTFQPWEVLKESTFDDEISNDEKFVVPKVEIEKLKAAAKNAGLEEGKADRIARAAAAMNMQYNDIVELRKMMNNPATSAAYADKVRRALEDAVVDQHLHRIVQPATDAKTAAGDSLHEPSNENILNPPIKTAAPPIPNPLERDPTQNIFNPFSGLLPFANLLPPLPLFRAPPPTEISPITNLYASASKVMGRKDALRLCQLCNSLGLTKEQILELQHRFASPTMTKSEGLQIVANYENQLKTSPQANLAPILDPLTLQTLKSISQIAGLNDTAADRLVRAVAESQLGPSQVNNFTQTIQEVAPSSTDLEKVTEHLEEKNKQRKVNTPDDSAVIGDNIEWIDQPKGAEWIFLSSPESNDGNTVASKITRGLFGFDGHGGSSLGQNDQFSSLHSRIFSVERVCGYSPKVDPNKLSNTSPGQYPWAAAVLSSDGRFLCGGILLSESIVLCPASCVLKYNRDTRNQQPLKVRFSWSLMEGHENTYHANFPSLDIFVASAVVHPSLNGNFGDTSSSVNDMGLLRLVDNIDFNIYPHIFPVCTITPSDEKYAGANNCIALGWPNLPEMEHWRPRSYLTATPVAVSNQANCAGPQTSNCIIGQVCSSNIGSPVICLANSQRYYFWGIINRDANCDRVSSITLPIVSALTNYDFISQYLFTPNPNVQFASQTASNAIRPEGPVPNNEAEW